MPKLSILILSIHERLPLLNELLKVLKQDIQVLWLGDNMSISVGAKRNKLLSIADGEYVCFIDDDDKVYPEYLPEILNAIKQNPDLITFLSKETKNGIPHRIWRFSKPVKTRIRDPKERIEGLPVLNLPPNHVCVWKKSVIDVAFPDRNKGEDHQFSELMSGKASNVIHLDKILYHYDYKTNVSRTQSR